MGRMERINQQMKREISNILQREFQDPRLTFVTVMGVEVSPDLHDALVSYSVLGDEKKIDAVAKILESLSGYIRKLIGERIRLRFTPKITFVFDQSIEYSIRIEKTLSDIKKQTQQEGQADNHPS